MRANATTGVPSFFTNLAEPRVEAAWDAIDEIDAHFADAFEDERRDDLLVA